MKYSRQRNIILDIVKNSYDHPTAETVYKLARKELPSIGIATVYRNLNQLVDSGEVVRISLPGGVDRFDGHLDKHYHSICPDCGRLTDLNGADEHSLTKLKDDMSKAFGLDAANEIKFRSVILECKCDKCRMQTEKRNFMESCLQLSV
ncbi:MAG: transcriptional repressor [[Eubacterium] sulci]|nr:transcriptional repressor [[Eubacterium] sulci]MBF1153573.1 transcriptional repressor [[Eubacterium] sulci]MBF1163361.1 transcriptional repressor [[Eubacterium] sulci]MBF1166818.1 transcriptional repressor [[Eubacterium] sulci]MBF1170144.1 transcriptional repressor [[Eubacterium] sulci]